MSGAGFGGCAIALVLKSEIIPFIDAVGKEYQKSITYAPSFYKCEITEVIKIL